MTAPETDDSPLLLTRDGRVATITLNDAPMNRMSLDFIDQLEVLMPELDADPTVGAVVVTGAGDQNFSVGMNLKQLPSGIKQKGSAQAVFDQRLRVIEHIETMSKPVVAVLYGYCLGGGLELPLGCHFRLAAKDGAKIGLPEMDLGTVPAWGGSARLTQLVGPAHALDMILRAKKVSGPEALRIGLVNEVWPNAELQERAQALAHELAAMPALAVAEILRAITGVGRDVLAARIAAERAAVNATMGTKDQAEGMRAFMEKRPPVFNTDS